MIQAEVQDANRHREILASHREAHAQNGAWIRGNLVGEVEDILADALEPQNQIENQELDGEVVLLVMDPQQLHDHIEQLLEDLRTQVAEIRNEQNQAGGVTD